MAQDEPQDGRLCVITGTSTGIGLALARELLDGGWRVIGLARREAPLKHTAYTHLHLDLSDLAAVQRTVETVVLPECVMASVSRVGLVNNAALLDPIVPVSRLTLDDLSRAYTVNSVVPVWLMGVFLRTCQGRSLRIVNVSSGAAVNARAGWGTYCATKAALRMTGEVWATEWAKSGGDGEAGEGDADAGEDVALLSYRPGVVDTAMQTQIRGTPEQDFPDRARFVGFHEEGRLKTPDAPAREIAAFLGRDDVRGYLEAEIGG